MRITPLEGAQLTRKESLISLNELLGSILSLSTREKYMYLPV